MPKDLSKGSTERYLFCILMKNGLLAVIVDYLPPHHDFLMVGFLRYLHSFVHTTHFSAAEKTWIRTYEIGLGNS